jgi:GAF domain-containing protein
MTLQASIDRELEAYAHVAAERLAVPFVTVQLSGDQAANAHFIDAEWVVQHPELDVADLNSPNAAVSQNLPFFACVPIRDGVGQSIGSLCCGGSEARDLDDTELAQLRAIAAQITADIDFGGQPRMRANG